MFPMRLTNLILLAGIVGAASATELRAQSSWLSTPKSIQAFRQQVEAMKPERSKFELASIKDLKVSLGNRRISVRIYDPAEKGPQPILVYVHGACWVAGSLESHDEVCRYLARQGGTVVVAIDYRLAPEHPFPAAHDDVFDVVRWLWDNADELGFDRNKFAIGGESAGAHLAAATAIRAMDEGGAPNFAFLLLAYAALDGSGSSWQECKGHYFKSPQDARSRYGSPLWVEDLAKMPKTFNVFGEYEPSRAEQELFIRKLREDGVSVESVMNQKVGHDVQNWLAVSGSLIAHEATIKFIRKSFTDSPGSDTAKEPTRR